MERSGPRIYVPLAMPDASSQPTYAVLEFVGFSTPSNSASPHLLPHATVSCPAPAAPAMLCLPHAPSSSPPASYLPPSLAARPLHSHHALLPPLPNLSLPHFPDNKALFLPSPPHALPPNSHHTPGPVLQIVNLESPPSSPSSSLARSTASSASRDSSKETNPHYPNSPATCVVKPKGSAHLVNSAKPSVHLSSPSQGATLPSNELSRSMASFNSAHALNKSMANFNSAEGPMANLIPSPDGEITQTKISVSQTDRETIVHTHSSNFRDVVRQLTGASSDDQDLMPVTLPARLANRVNNTISSQNVGGNIEGTMPVGASMKAGSDQLGLRKAPLKLHERRKSSMKNLEKITTAFTHYATELSPLNPSPVTPLASDFERFCNASTPTSQGSSALNSPINLISKGKNAMEALSSAASSGKERRGGVDQQDVDQQEGGCGFMHAHSHPPPAPRALGRSSPTLLNLFPESPTHSLLGS